jgi:competence protein ComEA
VDKINLFLKEFGILLIIALVGVGVLVYGLWEQLRPEEATVEIIKGDKHENDQQSIYVDVAGAVENPGLYQLPSGSRIGDTLVMSGGLSSSADREWVAKTINLAQEVKDGEKIYIPNKTLRVSPLKSEVGQGGKVNINTASLSELDVLEGIGEVRARAILDNRPYSKINDLVSRAKIPETVYEKIKDRISVY